MQVRGNNYFTKILIVLWHVPSVNTKELKHFSIIYSVQFPTGSILKICMKNCQFKIYTITGK